METCHGLYEDESQLILNDTGSNIWVEILNRSSTGLLVNSAYFYETVYQMIVEPRAKLYRVYHANSVSLISLRDYGRRMAVEVSGNRGEDIVVNSDKFYEAVINEVRKGSL